MTTNDYRVYNAHAKQRRFHKSVRQYDYVLFNGGRGSGKTTAGAIQSVLESCRYQPGSSGMIVAPSYPMLEDASMKEFFNWLPRHFIREFNKQRRIVWLTNGSEIAFRSADNPDSLRGPNRSWVWFDEARNLKTREAFDIAAGQMRQTRKFWLTTTPSGIFHWLYELFVEKPLPSSAMITVKSAENPHNSPDYATNLRAQYTGLFAAQELDAAWVSFEGRIYDNFELEHNVSEEAEYNPALEVMWGVDDGYAYGSGPGHANYHPRVILFGQMTPVGGLNIFDEYVAALELSEVSLDNALSRPYQLPRVAYVDSSAAELKARIWERGISTIGATHTVVEGIKNVRRMICDGNGVRLLRIHPRCVHLIREMQLYRYDEARKTATVGEPAPLKVDDHGPDAVRYLCHPLRYGS